MNVTPLFNELKSRIPDAQQIRDRLALPGPRPIAAFDNEKEIFRKGHVLVTDTRLAYIDPFDRMLKTYMFEHMISLDKKYYRGSAVNRRFCKGLLLAGIFVLLITMIIDLLDTTSRGFVLVYIPALLSMLIGVMVWRDMRPKYRVQWKMRDGSTDQISTEPMFREWMTDNKRREQFMDELAQAMNQALSGKAWWPATDHRTRELIEDVRDQPQTDKPRLKLVTDHYE
jgi:hypothetical protein